MGRSSTALDTLEPGYVLGGKYLVERRIGEGGMGVVYRALHLDLAHPVAIKVVRGGLAQRDELARRMLLEARAAANIRSEHVARMLDVGRTESGAPYIVMEYLEGKDLCDVLAQHGRLEHTIAIDFIVQACEAVAEAHTHGIVHRDLKPENLFLTTRADGAPVIKVLDFGIAKKLGPSELGKITNPATAVGSPHYMAPEQMRAREPVDHRADIWSLGAILYELIAGTPPFNGDTVPSVCVMALAEDPKPLTTLAPEVPTAVEKIVLKCLEKRPEGRYANVAELAAALAPFGSGASSEYAERVARVISGVRSRASIVSSSVSRRRRRAREPVALAAADGSQLSFARPLNRRASTSRNRAPWLLVAAGVALFSVGALSAAPWTVERWWPAKAAPTALVLDHKVTALDLPVNVEGNDAPEARAMEADTDIPDAGADSDGLSAPQAKAAAADARAPRATPDRETAPRPKRSAQRDKEEDVSNPPDADAERQEGTATEVKTEMTPVAIDTTGAVATAAPAGAAPPQLWRAVEVGGSL